MKTILGMHMYQFIVVSLSITMIFFGLRKFIAREQGQSLLKLAVRIMVWGGMAIVALFPQLTNQLAEIVGLEGNINAVILTGFLLVFLIIFKILSVVERIEQHISDLTRQQALDEPSNTKLKHKD
jgi:hypothetical protein